MAKIHTSMPDDLFAQLNATCNEYGLDRSKLIHRGIKLAIDEVKAWNRGQVAARPASPMRLPSLAVPASEPFDISTVARGDGLWFRLDELLAVLKVKPEALMSEIDEVDDVLEYAGQRWVDARSLAEARTLCRDHDLGDRVQAWADTKIRSLPTPASQGASPQVVSG